MLSKISLLNNALFKNFSKQIMFLTVINIIFTFLLIPFSYVMNSFSQISDGNTTTTVGTSLTMAILFYIGTCIYSVLCGVMLTYFLKSEEASDFIHSLPIKRNQLLNTTIIVFVCHLLVNLLINGAICLLIKGVFSISLVSIINWIILAFIIAVFCFAVTLLLGMMINNVVPHIVMSVLVIMSPALLNIIVYFTHDVFYKGLDNSEMTWGMKLTVPLAVCVQILYNKLSVFHWFIVAVLAIIILIMCHLIYRARKNENINDGFSFSFARYFTFIMTAIFGTTFAGLIAMIVIPDTFIFAIIIYIISFCLIYYLMEMITQKAIRIVIHKKLLIASLLGSVLAVAGIFISGVIREKYIPSVDDVKSVNLSVSNEYDPSKTLAIMPGFRKEKLYINDVIKSQKFLKEQAKVDYSETYMIYQYRLKNGTKVERFYGVTNDQVNQINDMVYTRENYDTIVKNQNWNQMEKFNFEIEKTKDISQSNQDFYKEMNYELSNKLVNGIKSDLETANLNSNKYNVARTTIKFMGRGRVHGKEKYVDFPLTPYHKETIKLLIEKKYIHKPSDVFGKGTYREIIDIDALEKSSVTTNVEKLKKLRSKNISSDAIKKDIDSNKIDPNGTRAIVYFDNYGNSSIFYMNK